jgi:hypothetical protein
MNNVTWLSRSELGSGWQDCGTCGATVQWSKQSQHENFHKTFSNRIGDDMSNVSWCDYGDHAFKRGAEGSASFSGTEYDSAGRPVDTKMDTCSDHNPLNIQRNADRLQISTQHYRDITEPNVVE